MPRRKNSKRIRRIVEVAAEWFIRGKACLRKRESRWYMRWFRSSPKSVDETLRLEQLHLALRDALQGMTAEMFLAEEDSFSNVIELKTRLPVSAKHLPVSEEVSQRPSAWRWKIAASVAVIALSGLLAMGVTAVWRDRSIETGASEWRTLHLTDGSVVRVGPHTRLNFDFGDNRRFADLQRGEAYFEVAKDRARPFVVKAEPVTVRAVGTAFGVTRHGRRVVVTVQEGVVAITRDNTEQESKGNKDDKVVDVSVPVSAGEQVAVSKSWPVAAKPVDVVRELDWAKGMLIFGNGDTVALAVGEFNQRNRVQIVVNDSVLGAEQVRGIFPANDPETFVTSVATVAGAEIVRDRQGVLRLVTEEKQDQAGAAR